MLVMPKLSAPSVKVWPVLHSTPKVARISPAPAASMSSMLFACMRTRRGIFTFSFLSTL